MENEKRNSYMYYSAFDKYIRDILLKEKRPEKFLVISIIILNTNFTESYKDLSMNESYFSYSYVEGIANIKRSKLQNIMKELEEEGYIQWSYKSNTRYKESILRLNFKHGKGYSKKYGEKYNAKYVERYGEDIDIPCVTDNEDTVNNKVKDTVENIEKDTYSKNKSKNKSKNISNYKYEDNSDTTLYIKVLEASKYYLKLSNTLYNKEKLLKLQNEFGSEFLVQAIIEAGKRDGNSLRYVEKVLNDWRNNKINTTIEIKEYISKRNKKNSENIKKENNHGNYTSNNIKRLMFNNFEARDCDYDDIARKLLGWDND